MGNDLWCYFYMVFDIANSQITKLKTNYLDLDPLTLPVAPPTPATANRFRISLDVETLNAGDPVYFDDVRLYEAVE